MQRPEHLLFLAVQAAELAADHLRRHHAGHKEVLAEPGRDIKLALDRESEAIILRHLANAGPLPVLTEETGLHGDLTADTPFWVVDPIDGTMNFFRGLPLCCISIALWQGEEPLLGLIYDFARDIRYTAIVGEGAWCNGTPMRVSEVTERRKAVLATGFPSELDYSSRNLERYIGLVQSFKKVRMLGTAALMGAYVAAGHFDAYGEDNINLWDVAAVIALVRAAGGSAELRWRDRAKWKCDIRTAASPLLWAGE